MLCNATRITSETSRSRNTLKLTPILKKLIGVEPEPNLVVVL